MDSLSFGSGAFDICSSTQDHGLMYSLYRQQETTTLAVWQHPSK